MIANGKQIHRRRVGSLNMACSCFFANYRNAMQIPRFTPQMEANAV